MGLFMLLVLLASLVFLVFLVGYLVGKYSERVGWNELIREGLIPAPVPYKLEPRR